MPVLGGIEAARAIRDFDAEIPILALTADTAAEDVEKCREAGMDGHLAKPVSLPALRTELDRRITPVLDDTLLDELADNLGGHALVDQMLGVYHDSLAGAPGRDPAPPPTPESLREAAHALRSPAAGFGIARLASRLRRVEDRRPRRADGPARRRASTPPARPTPHSTAGSETRQLSLRGV